MLGATSVTRWEGRCAGVAGGPSSSGPVQETVLHKVPAFSAVVGVELKENAWPGARTIGPLWPWATQAALAAAVRSPSTSSTTPVTVTGSVLAGLVLLMVKP